MDLDGTVYSKDGSFNAAGFTIHSGVYKARPDGNCVMHTHTRAGTGISVVLRNHGLLSVGATVPAALRRLYMLERACEVEIIARGLDEEPAPIDDDVVQQYAARAKAYRASPELADHASPPRARLPRISRPGCSWSTSTVGS